VAYNLTDPQKDLLRWMVQENRAGRLPDEFHVHWPEEIGGIILEHQVQGNHPEITAGALDALEATGLLIGTPSIQTQEVDRSSQRGSSKSAGGWLSPHELPKLWIRISMPPMNRS
jgi:hypothetical protein